MTLADLRGEGTESGGRRRRPGGPVLSVTKDAARLRSPAALALLYLVALAAAETLTALVEPRAGLALHALLLVALLAHSARTWTRPARDLLLCLAFAPLIRLLSLSMPLAGFPVITWYLIISLPLFVATVLAARTLGFSRRALGVTLRGLPVQLLVGLTGLVFGCLEYLILEPEPLAEALTWRQAWLPALVLLVCTGLAEELIFRGLMQRAAAGVLGGLEVPYVSAVFAVLHIGYLSLLDMLFVFWVALFFGWVVARTGSLVGVTLSHGLTNVALFLIVPFLLGPAPGPASSAPPAVESAVPAGAPSAPTPLVVTVTPSPEGSPPAAGPAPLLTPAAPTPTVTPAPLPTGGPLVHIVQPGESLYGIGLRYGVTWEALAAANDLEDPQMVQAGQALVIPAPGSPPPPASTPSLPTTHVVRPGENLYRIGLIYGVPWEVLAAANGLSDADTLYAGQILIIPRDLPPMTPAP